MNELRALERKGLTDSGVKPMHFDCKTPCNRGLTRVPPIRVREDCLSCQRPACGPGEGIDPVGAWVDATHHHVGYCRERMAPVVLTAEMRDAFDETAGLSHTQTIGRPQHGGKSADFGGVRNASTTAEGAPLQSLGPWPPRGGA